MRKLIFLSLLSILSFAKEQEFHSHFGEDNIKFNYEVLDFKNSKKKLNGNRYGVEIDHEDNSNHIQVYYEKSVTNTKDTISKNLYVGKYTIKYQYLFDKQSLIFLYSKISDNLMEEVDNGDIYGVGYNYKRASFIYYFSDYEHFNSHQGDLKYVFGDKFKVILIGKYIRLEDKNSNGFSRNANNSYFTTGLKLHTHYKNMHLGAGVYFGKRAFAIMKNGFKVQHHSMEFKRSYMGRLGFRLYKDLSFHINYGYHVAEELPIKNNNVKVQNISFDFVLKF